MGKIYCIIGKSSSGKDCIYRGVMANRQLGLRRIVPYTTRPIREGETPGEEYYFCDELSVQRIFEEGRIVELRAYHTVHGLWKYFTVDDGQINLNDCSYLYIVTLTGYQSVREYFGKDSVVPIYIEVEDGERLLRALERERRQKVPEYEEMCRRFLADTADFSTEKLAEAGVTRVFVNEELNKTVRAVSEFIAQSEHLA